MVAPCFWMRSVTCHQNYRQNYCGCYKKKKLPAPVETRHFQLMCELSLQPIKILRLWLKKNSFAKISIIGSMYYQSSFQRCGSAWTIFRCWLIFFYRKQNRIWALIPWSAARKHSICSEHMTGPATSGNWKMSLSVPLCFHLITS